MNVNAKQLIWLVGLILTHGPLNSGHHSNPGCNAAHAQGGIAEVSPLKEKTKPAVTRSAAKRAMCLAGDYFHDQVARRGGYVYYVNLNDETRWGEGRATEDQIWVQPPGTPTVGMAMLRAYQATHQDQFLDAARDAAEALVAGQLRSGGWTQCINFDPRGDRVADYRGRPGGGRNHSSLDDGQTQSALLFLMAFDEVTQFQNERVHEAVRLGLDALLAAQFANGAFPQVWTGPINRGKIQPATFPREPAATALRIKNYWDLATLNDNVAAYVADVLMEAHRIYDRPVYRKRLCRLGDFLRLAQLPSPQAGWAQQYDDDMQPVWARSFEPPAVSSDETFEVIQTLMKIAVVTGDPKYLEPIPAAFRWLRNSMLPTGELARFYECETNRPLYLRREGKQYVLTYDDANLPEHYRWKVSNRLPELEKAYHRVLAGRPIRRESSRAEIRRRVIEAIESLDAQGRWISRADGTPMVGQPRFPVGTLYLSSEVFAHNMTALAEYVSAPFKSDPIFDSCVDDSPCGRCPAR